MSRQEAPQDSPTPHQEGREAAEQLARVWPDVQWVPDAPSGEWALGALERFSELIAEQPAMFRASQAGSERGAESLTARRFQGILETLQNADDLGASELRLAIRRGPRRPQELLLVHNGAHVRLHHVGAMVLPWLTTKADDPSASGRFGIGLKTLRTLGGPLEAHCSPFHFRIDSQQPKPWKPLDAVPGFYDPTRRDTLLRVPLDQDVAIQDLVDFVLSLDAQSLLFLRSIRRLSLLDLRTDERLADHRLDVEKTSEVRVHVRERVIQAERVQLRDPATSRRYVRFLADVESGSSARRRHKATDKTTTVGVAWPLDGSNNGRFFDRVALPLRTGAPLSVNAQFDPDAARSTLIQVDWNESRFRDLGDLLSGAIEHELATSPKGAWAGLPLPTEIPDVDQWIQEVFASSVVERAYDWLRGHGKLGADETAIDDLVFEPESLEDVLSAEDQEYLASDFVAVNPAWKDDGRWRAVLRALGSARELSASQALRLLDLEDDRLGNRPPDWFLNLAWAVSLEEDVFEAFLWQRSVLLDDGRRIEPPGSQDPKTLVLRVEQDSLATRLGVALPLHRVYRKPEERAKVVRETLQKYGVLQEELASLDEVLEVLARDFDDNTVGRIQLTAEDVVALRDALQKVHPTRQKELGSRIGLNIEVPGMRYSFGGEVERLPVCPAEAYLPAVIDRETNSFARAAAKTPGLLWIDPVFEKTLKRAAKDRSLIGPQKLFALLGAASAPRLVSPSDEAPHYKRDSRPASRVTSIPRPDIQLNEIRGIPRRGGSFLLGDHWAPDLDAVIADIQTDAPAARRKKRSLALLAVLTRAWDRQYSDFESALATYPSDGYWQEETPVIATWLAKAASEPWLPAATGGLRAPLDLALPTDRNKLAYKNRKSMFLAPVDDAVLRGGAVRGLRLQTGPPVSALVDHLRTLQEKSSSRVLKDVLATYLLIAAECPGPGKKKGTVGDLTQPQLRAAFEADESTDGLLLIRDKWYSPSQVFMGPPLFGERAPFVPESPSLDPLWRVLNLATPDVSQCLAFLNSLAADPLQLEDRLSVLRTLRYLAEQTEDFTPHQKGRVRRLPVWDGTNWRTDRPVLAVSDPALAAEVRRYHSVWDVDFSSLEGMESLIELLGISVLDTSDFNPVSLEGSPSIEGLDLATYFAHSIDRLRDELLRSDLELHDSLSLGWGRLRAAEILIQPSLKLRADVPGRVLEIEARSHLVTEPSLTLLVRDVHDLENPDATGRSLASLFEGDRQKVAWAWASMWRASLAGTGQNLLPVPEEVEVDAQEAKLEGLQAQVSVRAPKKGRSERMVGPAEPPSVRPLKEIEDFVPGEARIVNRGGTKTGVLLPTGSPRRKLDSPTPQRPAASSQKPRTVLPPANDRETLAYEAVQRALRLDPDEVRDLRARRNIGADAVDELRQFFEIKMESSGTIPNEIRLTRSEVDLAQSDEDFFLAIVSGLEDNDSDLVVRFIFDPLNRLAYRIKGEVVLSGVREVEALEFPFNRRSLDSEEPSGRS